MKFLSDIIKDIQKPTKPTFFSRIATTKTDIRIMPDMKEIHKRARNIHILIHDIWCFARKEMFASPPDAHAIERSIRGTHTTSFDLVRVLWFYSRFCECGTRCFIYYSLPYHPSLFCFRSMPRSYAPSALRVLVTTKTWVMFISHVCIYPFVRGGKACWGWGASGKDVTKGP